jgi:hypothetical protein
MARTSFNSLLASVQLGTEPFGYKEAQGVEAPDRTQMEQDFARLAYMFVQDRAAGLIKYLLGFEVVNRDEDGSKAVGIFGFKVGNEYYYVPAFFLNNQIKGVDMIYSKRTNMFMPLQEDWINFIVNKQTIELGQGENVQDIQRYFESPNFNFIATPPISPKTAEVKEAGVRFTIDDAFDTWNKMQDWTVQQFEKDAEFQQAWVGFVSAYTGQPLPFEKTAEASPLISYLEQRGGPKAVSALMHAMENRKYANAALTFYPTVASLYVSEFSSALAPQKTASVSVLTSVSELGDSDQKTRTRLVRDGFAIKDDRKAESKSETYETDYTKRFSNPTKSGTYNVLLQNGSTTKCWVLLPNAVSRSDAATVIEQDKKLWVRAEPGAVYVRDDESVDGDVKDSKSATPDPYSKAVKLADMELNKEYCLVDEKGNATGPLEVTSVAAEDGKRTRLRVSWRGCYDTVKSPTYGHDFETLHTQRGSRFSSQPESLACSPDRRYLELADHNGPLKLSGTDAMIIPANWKALKLFDGGDMTWEKKDALRDGFKLGSLVDVEEAMYKNAFHRLTVSSDDKGIDYHIRMDDHFGSRPMNYKTAYCTLVGSFGLSVDDTEEMLKEAAADFKSRRLVKLAQQESPMVGVSMPYPNEPPPSINSYNGIQQYEPFEQNLHGTMTGVPPKPLPNVYGANLGGEAEMDSNAMQLATQAGNAGQKQIFDHASIGGLSKVYDTGSVIDSYVPELMKALDRVGRLIFMFYWKNEDFAERYGSSDMVEMEDLIRGVFKSFGELALKLRKKSIGNDDASSMAS